MKDNLPQRKKIRLSQHDYASSASYFITFCTKNRLHLLGSIIDSKILLTAEGLLTKQYLLSIQKIYDNIKIEEFVIMPNHIHMILTISQKMSTTVAKIVQQLKGKITKELGYSIWQPRFHDHVIRNKNEYYYIKKYIKNNVINWINDRYSS